MSMYKELFEEFDKEFPLIAEIKSFLETHTIPKKALKELLHGGSSADTILEELLEWIKE